MKWKLAPRKKKSGELPVGCLSLFGLPFFAAGLFIAWMYFSGLAGWWSARGWVETPCRIVAAELKVNRGSDSTTYRATGRFVYRWQGREYESERVSLTDGGDNLGDYQKRVHRAMKRAMRSGEEMPCHVNPSAPGEAVLFREFRLAQQLFMCAFAFVFPAVGSGLVVGGLVAMRHKRVRKRLGDDHPDEPWKWHPGWLAMPMPENGFPTGRIAAWLALWWWTVSLPLLAAGIVDGAFARGEGWWLLIPAALAGIPSFIALRGMRKAWRIGHSSLDLALPLRPGREAGGCWITGKPLHPRDQPLLKVRCKKTVTTSSGGESSTHSETIWEEDYTLATHDQMRDATGFRLPFRFRLPAEAIDSGDGKEGENHRWTMEFRIPGTAVKSTFEVPVFRSDDDPTPEVVSAAMSPAASAAQLSEWLENARLSATLDANGELHSMTCTPRRWIHLIVFLALFNLVWTAAAVFLLQSNAPMLFKLVWPVSAAGMWALLLHVLAVRRELTLSGDEIQISRRWLKWQRVRAISAQEVAAVTHATNTRVNNSAYYHVKIELKDGAKITVADGIAGETAALGLKRHLDRWRDTHAGTPTTLPSRQ